MAAQESSADIVWSSWPWRQDPNLHTNLRRNKFHPHAAFVPAHCLDLQPRDELETAALHRCDQLDQEYGTLDNASL